jgi:Tfp pilus assembly protein PilO
MSEKDARILLERLGKYRIPICLALGGAALAYAFLFFRPGMAELSAKAAEIDKLRMETLVGSREAEGLLRLENEISIAQTFLGQCEARAAGERRRGELLAGLSQAAEASGLVLLSMQPEAGTSYETFQTDVVRLQASGHYGGFAAFLAEVQELPFAIQVQECRLSAATPEGEGQSSLEGADSTADAESDRGDLVGSFVFAVFAGSADYSVHAGRPFAR